MSAEEKILEGIISDATSESEKIVSRAKMQADAVVEAAKEEAKAYSAGVVSAALIKAKAVKDNAESSSALIIRDAKLAKKRDEINKTVAMAKERIASLSDEEYFGKLTSLLRGYAKDGEGILFLGKSDLKRNLALFDALLKKEKINLKIDSTAVDISGGFILKYGNIEYNLSVDAIIAEKKDMLEDTVHTILFSEK